MGLVAPGHVESSCTRCPQNLFFTCNLLWVGSDSFPCIFLNSRFSLKKPCLLGTCHSCGKMEHRNDGTTHRNIEMMELCSPNFCPEVTLITTAHISLARLSQMAMHGVNGWEVSASVGTNNIIYLPNAF